MALPAFTRRTPLLPMPAMQQSILPAGPTAANLQQRVCCSGPMLGQTDRQTDGQTPYRYIDHAPRTNNASFKHKLRGVYAVRCRASTAAAALALLIWFWCGLYRCCVLLSFVPPDEYNALTVAVAELRGEQKGQLPNFCCPTTPGRTMRGAQTVLPKYFITKLTNTKLSKSKADWWLFCDAPPVFHAVRGTIWITPCCFHRY